MNKIEKDYVIIVGCGRFGSSVAEYLSKKRKSIVIIDKNEDKFSSLSENFSGFTIEADGTDEDILIAANIEKAGVLLATTNDDNTNIMIAQIAKKIYNVPNVIVRIFDPSKHEIYEKFEIKTISPTLLSMKEFKNLIIEENE
ncbi:MULTISPECIES: TrkA family potassium uptake protein [Fusobacterium]|uniref:potassium channel family protein n=1 Tax=Fusobacterium TaxID=848 RepID=UPI001032BA1E|nr:TrkA family potassium uptake protein [Fusobacterium ulcerans]